MPSQRAGRATILDVARAAEVSRQTVSNVVNNPGKVAPATLARVAHEIERLGFRPSRAARTLKQERAGAWGIELNSRGAGRLGSVLDAFLVELTVLSRSHDAHIVPFAAHDHLAPVPAYEDVVASRIADGFILTDTRHDDPRPAWLLEHGIPFASFGRIWDDPTITSWADVDGAAGLTDAVHHVAEAGYERVGYLGWPTGSPVGDDRRSGWLRTGTALGVTDESWQARSPQDLKSAAAAAAPLVSMLGRGGALVCASDVLAAGAWRAIVDLGLRPGTDFGLVGFDDTDLARTLELSTIRQPLTEVAERVLAILGDDDATSGPRTGTILTPHLVVRTSSTRTASPSAPHLVTAAPGAVATPSAGDRSTPDGEPT